MRVGPRRSKGRLAPVEDVRVCRFCGHIDPVDTTGRCQTCGLFSGLALVPRSEAGQIARRQRLSRWRRRLLRLIVAFALVGGVSAWALHIFFGLGSNPPRATTNLSASLGPHTWGQVRRTPQHIGFTPDSAPFPHHVHWTYRTSRPLLASPAVVENHVYLTTEDGRTVALDRHTGQPVWVYQSGWPSSSTPAVAGDFVIFALRPGRVTALNRRTGAWRWTTNLQHPILALTSPVVGHGSVYIGSADGKLYALDAATGRQRWAFATEDWIISTAAYTGESVIVASQDSRMYVVGADTGRQRFVYPTGWGRHLGASPAIQGDRAYFGSSGGRVSAMAWQNTTYPWERTILFWQSRLYLWRMIKTPPEQKGRVWSARVGGDVTHPPAIAHHTVYVTTIQGKVVALDTAAGAIRWGADLDVEITAAPTVAGDTVLIGTKDGVVVALDAYTGETLWAFKTHGQITGSPIVAGDTMYVVSHDGRLYAVTRSE
ncbi:Outer membrane protein assembly factor BamB [Candidatus Entotheonellaceae bacterium PAL068K]